MATLLGLADDLLAHRLIGGPTARRPSTASGSSFYTHP
jgi:hypothetical protein